MPAAKKTAAKKTAAKKTSTKKSAAGNTAAKKPPAKKPSTAAHWRAVAMAIASTKSPLSVPFDVFLEEAKTAARFLTERWTKKGTVPGLSRLRNRLPLATATEIHELVDAVQGAQTDVTLNVPAAPVNPLDRAEELVAELASALAFSLDDGVEDDNDLRYARVRDYHYKRVRERAAVGQDLRNHATLAASLRARLTHDDEEFDGGFIDEALALAEALAGPESAAPEAPAATAPAAEPVGPGALRNRLLTLLVARVSLVRRGAQRVYRKHPDVLAEVMSAHERERRAENRKAVVVEPVAPVTGGVDPAVTPRAAKAPAKKPRR